MKFYEGMFLFDSAVGHDWATMEGEVRRLCDRIGAVVHVCVKYDDRKLAFEIKGRKRGTFVLAYFDAPPEKMRDFERDANLSELLLRSMVLRPLPITPERLEELKKHPPETALMPHSERRDDRGDYRGDRGDYRGDRGDYRGDRGDYRGDRDRGDYRGDRDRGPRDGGAGDTAPAMEGAE